MREGLKVAVVARASRRSTTRTAGSRRSRGSGRSSSATRRCPCGCGSRSRTTGSTASPPLGIASGLGQRPAAARLPEGLHGRHARLADGADDRRHAASRSRRREELADIVRRAARARAGRSPCTRSATSRTRTRSTRSRRRATSGSRSACATASSTRSACARRTSAAFAELGLTASVQFSHAPSDEELAAPLLGRPARRRLLVPRPARLRARG